jgi:hypothetical protein
MAPEPPPPVMTAFEVMLELSEIRDILDRLERLMRAIALSMGIKPDV